MLKRTKHNTKNLHLSIASALLWINLCSITLLTAFNYYIFHHQSAKAYQENFISYNLKVTDLAFKNIDQQIMQSALSLPPLYFSHIQENTPLLLPQSQPIADSPSAITALTTEMQKISKSHPYIMGIDIYYEGTGTIVTHFNNVHFVTDRQQLDRYLPWYSAYRNMDLEEDQKNIWIMANVYLSNDPVILYIKHISGSNLGEKDITLCAYVDPDSFSSYIDQTTGHLLITSYGGQLLYGSGTWEDLPLPPPSETPKVEEVGDFVVSQYTSSTTGLSYYYAVDRNVFYQDYTAVNRMFLFNFLLSIGFNVVLLLLISYYNHTTYHHRIHILSENAGIPIDKSEKSFDSSLNNLEKEILKLHEAVGSSRGLVFQEAVRAELLRDSSGLPDDALLPYLTKKCCCVILISLPQADVDMLPVEELQEDYPPELKFYNVLFTATDRQNLAAVLIFDEGFHKQVWTDFTGDMDGRLKDYRLVTGTVASIKEGGIAHSYRCVTEAARYQYIFTEDRFVSYDLLKIDRRKNDGSHLKLFDAIQKDINSTNLFDLQSHIEMLVTSFKSGNYTIDYCHATLRDLVSLLYRIMQQNQLDTWVVFGYDIRAYYRKIENIDAFHSWCNTVCEMMLRQINQKRQSVDDNLHTRMLELIDEHLENDISLDLLADKLQIRANTASRVFRQVMGTGYTEYIKNRKLKRAEELIAQGFSVKDTAEKLGYSTPQYFIKVFKESYGMTPNQYKKAHEQEGK